MLTWKFRSFDNFIQTNRTLVLLNLFLFNKSFSLVWSRFTLRTFMFIFFHTYTNWGFSLIWLKITITITLLWIFFFIKIIIAINRITIMRIFLTIILIGKIRWIYRKIWFIWFISYTLGIIYQYILIWFILARWILLTVKGGFLFWLIKRTRIINMIRNR